MKTRKWHGQRLELLDLHLAQRDPVAQPVCAETELDLARDEDLVHAARQLRFLHHLDQAVDASAKLVEWHELRGIEGQVERARDQRLLTERLHRRGRAPPHPPAPHAPPPPPARGGAEAPLAAAP